jgi:hypothetical protein
MEKGGGYPGVTSSRQSYSRGGDGWRTLAAVVVAQAAKDMRRQKGRGSVVRHLRYDKERLRIEATVWLASKGATRWFDCCGLEQKYALDKMRWSSHAQGLLEDKSICLGAESTKVLELGLDALGPSE